MKDIQMTQINFLEINTIASEIKKKIHEVGLTVD